MDYFHACWIVQKFENKPHFNQFSMFGYVSPAFGEMAPRLNTSEWMFSF
jgi:hypothetical protein